MDKLEQIVALRQQQFDREKVAEEDNRTNDVMGAEMVLCRARLAVALERNELENALEELDRMESLVQSQLAEMALLNEMNRGDKVKEIEKKIELLDLQIERQRVEMSLNRAPAPGSDTRPAATKEP